MALISSLRLIRLGAPRSYKISDPEPLSYLFGSSFAKRMFVHSLTASNLNVLDHVQIIKTSSLRSASSSRAAFSSVQQKTIFALATPAGRGGVAIIRVSGPLVISVYQKMVRPVKPSTPQNMILRDHQPAPRKMMHCTLIDPSSEQILDEALVVFFKSPYSFTTEDVIELHVHSGRAVVSGVLHALSQIPGLRLAEAGEFTRRGYIAGRMDLTQVEGLHDLIEADTAEQRHIALNAVRGYVRKELEEMRSTVIQSVAAMEAIIDFEEADDAEGHVYEETRVKIADLYNKISSHLADNRRGEILRSGAKLTIFGPPNSGKSTLFNFLAQRDAAIVTPIAGTTRDVLELRLDLCGIAVVLADTAGLRETVDIVEQIGIMRAKKRIQNADISVCVLSLPEIVSCVSAGTIPVTFQSLIKAATFVILNKSDLSKPSDAYLAAEVIGKWTKCWTVSLDTMDGTDFFLTEFGAALREKYVISAPDATLPLITNVRQRVHLQSAQQFLEAFLRTEKDDIVFGSEELRYAADAIGKVTGTINIEEILDAIFAKFCIGK